MAAVILQGALAPDNTLADASLVDQEWGGFRLVEVGDDTPSA